MEENVNKNVLSWMESNIDEQSKSEILSLLKDDDKELIDSFYKNLEFGTGGMRGKMGVGTNRVNKYTIGLATQAFANYLHENFANVKELKVVIAYDSRNNSKEFAQITADVFSANNIKVFIFDDIRPTPELSFAIRNLNAHGGVVITASHNPKEYNGYKVYWDDGAQIVAPHDINIVEGFKKLSINDINFEADNEKIQTIGEDIDSIYLAQIKNVSINTKVIEKQKDLKILYTPLHGTGVRLLPTALNILGFENVNLVEEQAIADGNFPTVKSPNPENAVALEMALEKAKSIDADIVLATDPDADRVGVSVKDNNNEFVLLNGNQTGSILLYYILSNTRLRNKTKNDNYIVKTIVTSDLLEEIANKFNVKTYNVLTGFKYIAQLMREISGARFIGGFEESYGYLFSDVVRDKDAIMSGALICEVAAWAKEKGKTLYDILKEIHVEFGYNKDILVNLVKEGKEGQEEIAKIIQHYREDAPAFINDTNVVIIRDFLSGVESNLFNGEQKEIDLPKSNVLQFVMEDATRITIRPSGTEPKIKYYINIRDKIKSLEEYSDAEMRAEQLALQYKKAFGIID